MIRSSFILIRIQTVICIYVLSLIMWDFIWIIIKLRRLSLKTFCMKIIILSCFILNIWIVKIMLQNLLNDNLIIILYLPLFILFRYDFGIIGVVKWMNNIKMITYTFYEMFRTRYFHFFPFIVVHFSVTT